MCKEWLVDHLLEHHLFALGVQVSISRTFLRNVKIDIKVCMLNALSSHAMMSDCTTAFRKVEWTVRFSSIHFYYR